MKIYSATTLDGLALPIVDVTNPSFAISPSCEELEAMTAQYIKESAQPPEMPPPMREALSRSRIGGGLTAARGTFLSGLNTYLLKLGPDNLTPDFQPIDRRIAASFPAVTTRLRLQDMAVLAAEGLMKRLQADRGRPLRFINIAGGPAADTWNTLLKLAASGAPLAGRDIAVFVLDLDDQGPAFGARAFEALQAEAAPLNGLFLRFRHFPYSWSNSAELATLPGAPHLKSSLCAASSEGGLFEYGSDDEIVENLSVLHRLVAEDAIVTGTACRESEATRAHTGIGVTLRPRSRDAFRALVERGGWRVDDYIERPFNDSVRLVKSEIR